MIMLSSPPLDLLPHATDGLLILISALAVLYCAMLNRRLKKLSDMKIGVGASILTLTQAIEQTYAAAKHTQSSTQETTQTLRHLLEKSEQETPKIEALVTELIHAEQLAEKRIKRLESELDRLLEPAIKDARDSAKILAVFIREANRQSARMEKSALPRRANGPTDAPSSRPTPSIVQNDDGGTAKLVSVKS